MPTILLRRRDIFYNSVSSIHSTSFISSFILHQSHHDCSCSLFEEKIFAPLLFSTLHPLFLRWRKETILSKRFIDYRSIGAQFKSSNRLSLSSFSLSFSVDEKEIRQYKSRLSRHCSTTIMRLFVIPAPTDQIFLISWILPA